MTDKEDKSGQKDKPKQKQPESISSKIIGEIIGVIIGLIVLVWLVPKFSFVTDDYQQWLSIGVSTAILTALIKIVGIIINLPRVMTLASIGSLLVSIWSTYYLLQIFPFDFSAIGYGNLNALVQFGLTIALWAMAFAILVNFIKFLTGSSE